MILTYVGIDPGQRGAVAAVRVTRDRAALGLRWGHGRGGYHGPRLSAVAARAALAEAVVEAGGAGGEVIVGLEALGLRRGEDVRATSTAAQAYGVWLALLELDYPDQYRIVSTAIVDRAMGIPRGVGAIRKALVIVEAAQAAMRLGVPGVSLVPPGGRTPSDGAADALLIALALQRGL
jgi:hypothetical protein